MSAVDGGDRAERRAATFEERHEARKRARIAQSEAGGRRELIRKGAFGLLVVVLLGGGIYLAAGDFFGQRGAASNAGAISVRLSMAGFTPSEIHVPAGQTASIELWTTDAAPHLNGGVHTMISDELGIYEELAAAGMTGDSRRVVSITAPATPGTYDIYCNTCCGGKDSPQMHGKLVVDA